MPHVWSRDPVSPFFVFLHHSTEDRHVWETATCAFLIIHSSSPRYNACSSRYRPLPPSPPPIRDISTRVSSSSSSSRSETKTCKIWIFLYVRSQCKVYMFSFISNKCKSNRSGKYNVKTKGGFFFFQVSKTNIDRNSFSIVERDWASQGFLSEGRVGGRRAAFNWWYRYYFCPLERTVNRLSLSLAG